jgi:general stress protein 26
MRASQSEFDGVLWFFIEGDSPKAREVAGDGRVLLAYADPRAQNYVSIYGEAEVVRDPAMQKKLWREPLRTWFPGGAEDPKVALLKVACLGAEYWDAPSSTLVHAYGYIKAVATGKPPHPGANDKVDFTRRAG